MNGLRTLVVEDDAMIGELLAETLAGLGHTVCAVESDVANAVAAAAHWRPDLMIVDVGLGEASGIVAVKEILRSGYVPHVFVTGDTVRGMPLGPETFKSPSACRIWSERFNGRSHRRRFATTSRSKRRKRRKWGLT
jgi:two-component system, response regulator PdtaR